MMRFFVSPDRVGAVWLDSLYPRIGTEYADWIDCTDLDDAQFETFMMIGCGPRKSIDLLG